MKRLIVFLMLLALPIRMVLVVSGFGCAGMPMQMPQAGGADRAPCPMHVVGTQIAAPIEAGSVALFVVGVLFAFVLASFLG